ncbi:MAG TPA: pseudouridine synthase, partial [Thermoguttaceae bacterium]|nr:pseudouridine synthase [Thermoguttaceae bacterium]
VAGRPLRDRDVIEEPIGMHPRHREKMAIRRNDPEARRAETFYEVVEPFDGFALVRAIPKTGRTHQIRLHLDHVGCPVLCDRLYGGRAVITRGEIRRAPGDETVLLDRQALHAHRLRFVHPETNEPLVVEAPLPADMEAVLTELRAYRVG